MPMTTSESRRPSVAIVGSGVSGLTAAYLLNRTHDVTLFEADARFGGHANSHDITDSDGARHVVDSGFIVHNDVTYPWLRKLLGELNVQVQPTEMSMSIRCDGCGLEYAGGRGAVGVFAQRRRALDRTFMRLLVQVRRFHRHAALFLADGDDETTYGEFLSRAGFTDHFISHHAMPIVSCVWSSGRERSLDYPAKYLFEFLDHHGMLSIGGSHQWYTVLGGSRTYVERLAALLPDVRSGRAVTDITRHDDGVDLRDVTGAISRVDRVVIATHADQALALLTDPTDDEVSTLKAFEYSDNLTLLHTDGSVLPRTRGARASWNFRMRSCTVDQPVVVSYWMNKLHGLTSPDQYLVTLNDEDRINPTSVVATMRYEHPIYTPESLRAQARLAGLATARTAYAGAYHGWGFHEDGCRSGVAAAEHFGVQW
jgi:predicted NAD/FAD-binding protein